MRKWESNNVPAEEFMPEVDTTTDTHGSLGKGLFADAVQGRTTSTAEIYTGEGELDITDDLDISDVIQA